jgi:Uma2 family endonuclease
LAAARRRCPDVDRDQTLYLLGKTLRLYQAFGVPGYWAVDPDSRSLTIYVLSPTCVYERVRPIDGRLSSSVLPDLVIDLAAIFRDLPGEVAP